MTYRVGVLRTVRQVGFVEIEAQSEEEARDCVERLSQDEGHGALAPTWTEDIRMGRIEIEGVQVAA